jgi:ferredoxin-NADP reductase
VLATLERIEKLKPRVITFWFKPEARVRFEPGQFAEVRIPHTNVDNRGDMREFSITSLPDEPKVAITANFAEHGSSFKQALMRLRPGDEVFIAEPMGDFVLPKDATIPLVFVAAGIGSTPYVSMVKWLAVRNERRKIQFIYSVSSPDNFIFLDLFRGYPLELIPIVSRAADGWDGQTGRLSAEKLLKMIDSVGEKLIYLAGPQSFIEPLYNKLLGLGIPRRQLLLDYFPGY